MADPGGFSHPDRIVANLHIPEGAKIADFGCGSGYFTLLLAELVGPSGMVSAIDVQQAPLDVVRSRAGDKGLSNIVFIRGNLEKSGGSNLEDNSQDMVLLANILFREAVRVLRPGGEIVIIDWIPRVPFGGPHEQGWKLSADEGRALAQTAGLSFVKEIAASINHWGLLFRK